MADTKFTCGINSKNIQDYLDQGMTEDEVASQVTKELNHTFQKYKEQKEAREKAKKETLEKEYARAQARSALVKAFEDYLTSLGYEITGDYEKLLSGFLNRIEKLDNEEKLLDLLSSSPYYNIFKWLF